MDEKEHYISVKPSSKSLQKYIAYYYFNFSNQEDYKKRYIFYPHFRNAITVYKRSKISFSKTGSTVVPDASKEFEIIYTGIHNQSRIGEINAPFDKIGIVFQPLGINNFLSEPFSDVIKESPINDFNYFGHNFEIALKKVYNTNNVDEKVAALDAFFKDELNPLAETRIIKAVNYLFEEDLTIQELSEKLQLSRKTVLRLFRKHLNCSPKEFSNLVKFRKAIEIYQKGNSNFTELAHANKYYDQSDFIKHFKKATGFNPKKFFSGISHLGTEDTFWTLLKN